MNLSATGNFLRVEKPVYLTQGTVGQKITITLDEVWSELSATAVFSAGQAHIDVVLDSGVVTIPWELLSEKGKKILVNLYGTTENGNVIITTNIVSIGVVLPANSPYGISPEPYSPSRLDQIQELSLRAQRMASVAMGYAPKTPTVVDDKPICGSENFITSGGVHKALFRKNLLDNWYFGNPVNQRGKTSFTGTGYTIDRWKNNSENGSIELSSEGIIITNSTLLQDLDFKSNGNTYTFSVLIKSAAVTEGNILIRDTNWNIYGEYRTFSGPGLYTVTAPILAGFTPRVQIFANGSTTILAAKLELGDTQTLAHQENGAWVLNEIPDYGVELRKCQRYYVQATQSRVPCYIWNDNGTYRIMTNLNLPVPMRAATPVLSKFVVYNWIFHANVGFDEGCAGSYTINNSGAVTGSVMVTTDSNALNNGEIGLLFTPFSISNPSVYSGVIASVEYALSADL